MKIRAELRCLNCARFLGELLGDPEEGIGQASLVVPGGPPSLARDARGRLSCRRCGGKPVLDEIERIEEATLPALRHAERDGGCAPPRRHEERRLLSTRCGPADGRAQSDLTPGAAWR